MRFLKGCYGNSMVFLWDFHWIPVGVSVGFLWDPYGVPVAFLWEFHDVSMIFLWDYHGMPEGILRGSYGISLWLL